MRIGLLLPSIFASKHLYQDRIFAPRDLLTELADGLVARGHSVIVFSTPDFKTKAQVAPVSLEYVEKQLPYYKFRNLEEPRRAILNDEAKKRLFEIEVITMAFQAAQKGEIEVIHSYHSSIFFTDHYLQELVKTVPVIYSLHDPVPPGESIECHELAKFMHHSYIAISKNMIETAPLALNFVETIYHGLDVNDYPYMEEPKGDLRFVGRIIPEKGLADALEAALQLQIPLAFSSSKNFMDTKYFQTHIERYMQDPLTSEQNIPDMSKRAVFYGDGKALLFPIHWEEPFGMVMIEVMACGTPVIAYARGSTPEIIADGKTGFIVNESDSLIRGDWVVKQTGIEGLKEAVKRLYALSPDEYRCMRQACRARVEEIFTLEKMVDGYEKVYQRLLQ